MGRLRAIGKTMHFLRSAMALAADKTTELENEVTVVADSEGPISSFGCNHILSSKPVRRIRGRRRNGRIGFSAE
jgi:hypothetical protein